MLSLNSFSTFDIIPQMYLYKESSPSPSKSFCSIDKAKLSECAFLRQVLHPPKPPDSTGFLFPDAILNQWFSPNPCTIIRANPCSCFAYSTNTSLALLKTLPQNYGGYFHSFVTLSIHSDASANQLILVLTSSIISNWWILGLWKKAPPVITKGRTLPFELLNRIPLLLFQFIA